MIKQILFKTVRSPGCQAPGDKVSGVEAREPLSYHQVCHQNLGDQREARLMGLAP